MSKSLARVTRAIEAAGLGAPIETDRLTRTAAEAAAALGVEVDQIGKSIVFRGAESGAALLFLTAGGNRVDTDAAAALAGEPLLKADADFIRATTGFAIGGVSPLGATTAPRAFMDARLLDFDVVWCAAGTPRHNFPAEPRALAKAMDATVAAFNVKNINIAP